MIKRGIEGIVGKTISGILVKRRKSREASDITNQIMLIFSDGTYYEIWENTYDSMSSAGKVFAGGIEAARNYVSDVMDIIDEAYIDRKGNLIVNGNPSGE